MSADLFVAVLAGGEGRRMGGEKALRPFRGTTLLGHAVGLARRWSDAVVIAVRDPAQAQGAAEAPLIVDRADVPGPLAGLAAALDAAAAHGARRLLTLPCDMPELPTDLLRRLCQALDDDGAGVALPEAAGRLQPACGLWRVAHAREKLPAYLASGQSSLWRFAEACGLAVAPWPAEAAEAFANVNTPEDLARLERG